MEPILAHIHTTLTYTFSRSMVVVQHSHTHEHVIKRFVLHQHPHRSHTSFHYSLISKGLRTNNTLHNIEPSASQLSQLHSQCSLMAIE